MNRLKNKITKTGIKRLLYICIPVILFAIVVIAGSILYQNWQNRVIYSDDEVMYFTDFSARLEDYTVMDSTSMLTKDMLNANGSLKTKEDCNTKHPRASSYSEFWQTIVYVPNSDYSVCESLNEKLDVYDKYEKSHRMVALNIKITSYKDKSIRVSDLNTYVNVPSGRDVTKTVALSEFSDYVKHTPYGVGGKEGYLHGDLSRTINMWTDILNEEKLIDIVLIYHGEEKIFRLEF